MSEPDLDRELARLFCAHHPAEAARGLERQAPSEIVAVWNGLPAEVVAPVVAAMQAGVAAAALERLDPDAATRLLDALFPPVAAALLRRLGPGGRAARLRRLSPRAASRIEALLRYPPDTAGALLEPAVFTTPPDATVAQVWDQLKVATDPVAGYVFVVDRRGALTGVVDLTVLLRADPDRLVGAVATTNVFQLSARADRERILAHPAWGDLRALPVVDAEGRFLGVLRYRTLQHLERSGAAPLDSAVLASTLALGELWWHVAVDLLGEVTAAVGATTASDGPRDGRSWR